MNDVINSDFDGRCSESRVGLMEYKVGPTYLLKTGSVATEETWTGSLSQTSDALDETDLEVAYDVFLQIWL